MLHHEKSVRFLGPMGLGGNFVVDDLSRSVTVKSEFFKQ
jgi:hypothetical protein